MLPVLKCSPSAPVLVENDLQSCVSMKDILCLNRFSIRDAFWGRRNHLTYMIVPIPSPRNNYASSKQSYFPNPHSPVRPHKTPLSPTRSHNHPAKTPNDPTTTQHDSTLHHTIPHDVQQPPPPLSPLTSLNLLLVPKFEKTTALSGDGGSEALCREERDEWEVQK